MRPTLSYLFENNETFKAQSIVPESVLPAEPVVQSEPVVESEPVVPLNFAFQDRQAIVAPQRVVLGGYMGELKSNGANQPNKNQPKNSRSVRRRRSIRPRKFDANTTVIKFPSRDLSRVVPFSMLSETSSDESSCPDDGETDEMYERHSPENTSVAIRRLVNVPFGVTQ